MTAPLQEFAAHTARSRQAEQVSAYLAASDPSRGIG